MSSNSPIDFWFTMGSTYTYLSVMRLPNVQEATGVSFRWRPFHLLAILREMKHIPFSDKPTKMAYMWRDIERRAERYGCPFRAPAPYPVPTGFRANRVALVGMQEGWGGAFVRSAYKHWFHLGQETGSEPNLSNSLNEIGQDPKRVLELADSDETARIFEAETETARELGIFGSPTFVVGRELFWGDDRLEDALQLLPTRATNLKRPSAANPHPFGRSSSTAPVGARSYRSKVFPPVDQR